MSTRDMRLQIANSRAKITGDFTSATRAVDALLDLRRLAEGRPGLIETVDGSLREMPGWFVARNDWWISQLDRIELALVSDVGDSTPEPAAEPASR